MSRYPFLSRRTLLRGLGCGLALPWLEAMAPRAARAAPNGPPIRLAFLFAPNGVDLARWTPGKEGPAFDLPPILQPLEPVRDEVLVLSGLTHDKARANGDGPGDHARSSAVFLTGVQPKKTAGADIRVGISVDQVAARARGNATVLPSLEIGCEPARQSGNCDSGYSCAYSSSISWRTPQTPMGKEVHPRLAFERLVAFGDTALTEKVRTERRIARRSILDYVHEDARRLRGALGGPDRRKLDEYLAAVRQLERRIEAAERSAEQDAEDGPRLPDRIPRDYRDHIRLMNDLIVLAFRGDRTRIVSFMLGNGGSNRSYPFLGVRNGHHELSHHGGDETKVKQIRAINRFHTSQLSYLLQRLAESPEGEGTLLDSCLVVYGSGISDGNRHNHDDLPILLAGRGGGTIAPGRHVRYAKDTPACNLFLSLLDRFGAPVPTLGDASGRLGGLDA